ncbi:methyl-accepting chemotaxis protein [Selenomonas dianae]|uniref:Methyl-accepting chemotaxis protein n=1 Tax=Selenomonas dianae TaxID=135079 RepID=A0ABP3CML2_9FIRM|nr:methyl-accepting chemotaxis protein [Selenomonas dianae]WLD81993.1 methyl-accepting chemotaxis protein [Selenomonas dianae]
MSVAKKIVLSVGFLVVMFGVYGFYANQSGSVLNNNTVSVFSWAHVLNVGGQVQALSADGREYELMRITAPNEEERMRAAELISQLTPKLNKAYEEYEQAIQEAPFQNEADRTQKLARLDKLKQERKAYADVRQRATELINAGDQQGAVHMAFKEQADVYKRMTDIIEEDKADSVRLARAEMAHSEEIFSGVQTITVISLLIVVILSIVTLVLLLKNIKSSVDTILDGARHIAGGDLRSKIMLDGDDEFAHIAHQFNTMVESMQKMIRKIKTTATEVAGSSEELTANANQSAQVTQNVAQSITEVAEAAEKQMTIVTKSSETIDDFQHGLEDVIVNQRRAREQTQATAEKAAQGNAFVQTTVEQMNSIALTVQQTGEIVSKLGERSKEIGNIVEIISNISGQTNLLALNAAIEAARAGEHGRGFAVVAEEVRKLAEESQNASQQIAELIRSIQEETDRAVSSMEEGRREAEKGKENVTATGESFSEILHMVEDVKTASLAVSKRVLELRDNMGAIIEGMGAVDASAKGIGSESQNVSAATEEQAAGMEEIASSSRSLANMATDLQSETDKFKV